MVIELLRLRVGSEAGDSTVGTLRVDGGAHLGIYTLELPWLGNRHNVSCIPEGEYVVTKQAVRGSGVEEVTKGAGKEIFVVNDVPGRSGILIHPGNTLSDIKGCILPGLAVGPWESLYKHFDFAVFDSRRAHQTLLDWTKDEAKFNLIVKSV